MPLFRPSPRIFSRALQARTYATAQSPAINVTNVPAPHCGSIRILSLNRPAARNAISRQLLAELSHQINSIQEEGDNGSTRALILASDVDSSFCAGADLKERATFTPEEYVRPEIFPLHLKKTARMLTSSLQYSHLPCIIAGNIRIDFAIAHPHNLCACSAGFWWRPRVGSHYAYAHLRFHHHRRSP